MTVKISTVDQHLSEVAGGSFLTANNRVFTPPCSLARSRAIYVATYRLSRR